MLRRVLAALVLMGLAVGACGGGGSDVKEITAPASPGEVREQLDWVLQSGAQASDVEVAEHLDPSFLERVSPDALRSVLANLGRASITKVTSSRPNRLVAAVTSTEVGFTATIAVQAKAPHRIAELTVTHAGLPAEPASWKEVDRRLGSLADHWSVLAAEVGDDGALHVLHEQEADQTAPIGSMFKLYVLGALVEAVRADTVGWDDEVTVEPGDLSIGGGPRTQLGARLTVREAATLMISVSDNTAADVIMRLVGRGAVEAMLEPMGMGAASRARTLPFLTAREAFTLKWGSRGAAYAAADQPGRRAILAGLDEPLPDPFTVDIDKPAEVDRIEWFAAPREVAAAHVWLDAARTGPGGRPLGEVLGSDNPGLVVDPATWVRGAFKGGSEAGVLALSWLLERRDGHRFVVVMQTSSATTSIDVPEGGSIGRGLVDLVAHAT